MPDSTPQLSPNTQEITLKNAWPNIACLFDYDPSQHGPTTALRNVSWFQQDALSLLAEVSRHGDGIARFNLGYRKAVVASSHEAIKATLSNAALERTTESTGFAGTFRGFSILRDAIGESLPVMKNAEAKARRRWILPAMAEAQRRWLSAKPSDDAERFRQLIELYSDPLTDITDVHRVFCRFVFERLCFVLFGNAYAEVSEEMTDLIRQGNRCLHDLSTLWWPTPVAYLRSDAKRLRKIRRRLRGFAKQILADLKERESDDQRPAAAFFLCDFNALSPRELEDEIVTQFIAGTETTLLSLSWTTRCLAQSPTWWQRLRTPDEYPHARAQCLKEGLRLFPPFWQMFRVAQRDTHIMDKDIKRGTVVFASPLLAQRHPEVNASPAEFLPSRESASTLAFGFGARSCVGARLSQTIVDDAMQALAAHATSLTLVSPDDADDQMESLVFGLTRRDGFRLRLGRG